MAGGWEREVILDHNVSAQWRQSISAAHVIGGVWLQGSGSGCRRKVVGVTLCAKHRVTYQLQFIETRCTHLFSPWQICFPAAQALTPPGCLWLSPLTEKSLWLSVCAALDDGVMTLICHEHPVCYSHPPRFNHTCHTLCGICPVCMPGLQSLPQRVSWSLGGRQLVCNTEWFYFLLYCPFWGGRENN